MTSPRKLSFDNSFLLSLVQSTEVDCLPLDEQFYFPDNTTPVNLVWNTNYNDFIEVFSALMFGADFAYPETAQDVVMKFLKMVCQNMSICEAIIDCIENDTDTQTALLQYLSNAGIQPASGDNPPTPISPSQSEENLLPAGYTCDNDHLFGMARWIVTQLDLSTRQVLEAIELLTNDVELASVFADNVEGVSWFGSGLELAAWLQDQLIQWYDAAYTPTNEDALACEIFCIIKETCEVSIDNILQAYSGNSFGVPTDVNDWISVLDWLINTTFDGSIGTVATYHYFILQALRFASKLPIFDGLRGLRMIIGMGADETDSDWSILCDECPETWSYCYDFSIDEQGWRGVLNSDTWLGAIRPTVGTEPASIYGSGSWGEKFITTTQTFPQQTVSQIIDDWTAAPVNVDTVKITMNYTKGQFDTSGYAWLIRYRKDGEMGFTDAPSVSNTGTSNGSGIEHTFNIEDVEIAEICVSIRSSIDGVQDGIAEILHLEINGNGINTPPDATDCSA